MRIFHTPAQPYSGVDVNRKLASPLIVYVIAATALSWTVSILDERFKAEVGLTRSFYEGTTFDEPPVWRQTAQEIDLDFLQARPELPQRFFSVLWRGVWYVPRDQSVDIYAAADDQVRVRIDGEVVLHRSPERGMHTASRRLTLGAGFHDLTVRYGQSAGGYHLNVMWAPAGGVPRPFDPETLFPKRPDDEILRTHRRLAQLQTLATGLWFGPPVVLISVIGGAFLTRSLVLMVGGVSAAARRLKRRWPWAVALLLGVVLVGSLVGGYLRSTPPTHGIGDGAALEIFALHATHGDARVGPYSRFGWNQLGPAYFYALAPLYRLSGAREFSLNWTALILNLFCVLAIVLLSRRYGGPPLAAAALAALSICFFQAGPEPSFSALLSSPWNPHVPMLPLALLLVLCAALAAGFIVVLPAIVVVASFVIQTHLGLAPLCGRGGRGGPADVCGRPSARAHVRDH